MKISQLKFTEGEGWDFLKKADHSEKKKLVFMFADRLVMEKKQCCRQLMELYPNETIISCSTAGDIIDDEVLEGHATSVVVEFEKSNFETKYFNSKDFENDKILGLHIAEQFDKENLRHVIIISEGTHMNGSDLTEGLSEAFGSDVTVSGGLSGDGGRFEKTLVGVSGVQSSDMVVAVALYGDSLNIGLGSEGGFEKFGPWRTITKSEKNVLYEIDGKPALALYKEYLGEHAKGLPETALLFPLWLKMGEEENDGLVRTILNIDEGQQKMTFAGNLPEGSMVKLMRTNNDNLLSYSGEAAVKAKINTPETEGLALLVSCVGRRAILNQRAEEEVEEVKQVVGDKFAISGFYSYGEISINEYKPGCELYNQSMTVTTITED